MPGFERVTVFTQQRMPLHLSPIRLRPICAADLDAVLAVQAACYPAPMLETAAVVLARLHACPDTVLVACDCDGVCAYLFAYPSLRGRVTPLGGAFTQPAHPDTLYLHDLAVAPRAAGRGVGRALVNAVLDSARNRGLVYSALVAVLEAPAFWFGLGYAAHDGPVDSDGLATYPAGALYLSRPL